MRNFLFLTVLLLAPTAAWAQPTEPKGDWSLRVGGAALLAPSYEGSNSFKVRALPLVDLNWRDTVFLDTRRGLGANVFKMTDPQGRGALKIGPFVNWRFEREESDDDDLRGLGDVKGGIDVGAFANYTFGRLEFDLSGKRNVSETDLGGTIELGMRYRLAPIGRTMVSFGPRATWADGDFMKTYFGVPAAKASAAGLAAYTPSSGVKDVGVGAAVIHPFGQAWALTGFGGYNRLVGDAADSPLVKQRGTPNQFSIGLGISYKIF
jgi:MipA family protein